MLLAALCRARKIPARIAIGLVYYPPAQGFAYHMWTEVWIEDRWMGLDATLGDGGIAADHLKLAVSSLAGASAYADLLPVVQAIGKLQLEVVKVD
jgi:transglutaminase/protease-like cytokinesis protein 3